MEFFRKQLERTIVQSFVKIIPCIIQSILPRQSSQNTHPTNYQRQNLRQFTISNWRYSLEGRCKPETKREARMLGTIIHRFRSRVTKELPWIFQPSSFKQSRMFALYILRSRAHNERSCKRPSRSFYLEQIHR